MTELMKRILAAKLKMGRELADLPFDQKLDLMEKIRERNQMLAENPPPHGKSILKVHREISTIHEWTAYAVRLRLTMR